MIKKIVFTSLLFFSSLRADLPAFTVSLEKDHYEVQLQQVMKGKHSFESLQVSSDSGISEQEVRYLFGLHKGALFSAQDLCLGLERLKKKNKISSVTFSFEQGDQGIIVQVAIKGFWTLRAIKIRGISFGKQNYYPLYGLSSGDRFDQKKHEQSVKAIQDALKKEGYLEARVSSHLSHNASSKEVNAVIRIAKGQLFKVSSVDVNIASFHDIMTSEEMERLQFSLHKKIAASLVGKTYTNILITKHMKIAKDLLQERGLAYAQVRLEERKQSRERLVGLTITIALQAGRSFVFFGNHYFSVKKLTQMVTHFGKDTALLPPQILAQELIAEYQKKGFWNVSIDTEHEDKKDFFIIKEGPRIQLHSVEIKGVEVCDARLIHKKFLEPLTQRSFDSGAVQIALSELVTWYRKRGFWEAEILKKSYVSSEKDRYTLVIVFDEGVQRFITDVTVEGYPEMEAHPLFATIKKAHKPIPFAHTLLGKQRDVILQKMRTQGFLQAQANYTLKQEEKGMHVVWTLNAGPRITFGKTVIAGGTNVSSALIIKRLAYKEGDVWDKEKLQRSLGELRRLDVFEKVSLQPLYKDKKSTSRDVLITLQEDDPFEVKTRLGFQQVSKNFAFKKESSYKIGASLVGKNPFKKADRIVFDFDATRFEKRSSLSYSTPFLWGMPLDTTLKAYANNYTQPVSVGSDASLYQATKQGFLCRINKAKKHSDISCAMGFEWMETKNASKELAQALHFDLHLVDKKVPYFFVEPSIMVHFLDNALNPTRGFFARASLKGMFPHKDTASYLIKLLLEEGAFVPLKDITFASRIRFGHIFRKRFSAIMPPERFYLGGSHSLRGYQPDKCPPLGSFIDKSGITQWVAKGGKSMLNVNLELRIPMSKQPFFGVIFQDFGALVEDVHALLRSTRPLAATGFGFRYITPIGPLRFDIGWKWHKETPQESSYAWFLTFGHAF